MASLRPKPSRLTIAALLAALACAVAGCSAILGLDSGKPRPDDDAAADSALAEGSPEEASRPDAGYDATLTDTGVDAPEEATRPLDAAEGGDAPSDGPIISTLFDVGTDACTSDPSWCDLHCGTGPDNCGVSRVCNAECALGYVCDSNNLCKCQSEPGWCTARCGDTVDNCNNPIDCGPCDAGGEAACDPEDLDAACGSQQCGQATNNCGQLVNCGPGQLAACALSTEYCLSDGGCCSPDNAAACGTHCGGFTTTNSCGLATVCSGNCGGNQLCFDDLCCTPVDPCNGACAETLTDNCGQSVLCVCTTGQECVAMTCCTPSGCSGDCVDSCGAASPGCCLPEAGPPDASSSDGAPPVDAMPAETGAPESGVGDSGVGAADAAPDSTTGGMAEGGTGSSDSAGAQGSDAGPNDGTTSDSTSESDSGADDAAGPGED